jgi:hypothetical protein
MENSLTLIASMRCTDGLILGADTEEVISEPPLLRTRREKIRVLETPAVADWRIVLGGAGEYDYIGMIGDFIEEKLRTCGSLLPNRADVDNSIRAAVAEVWREYARYEQRTIDIKLLIASRAENDRPFMLTVVSGAAVRKGADIEAIGIGDATFKALADRFIQHGRLSTVSANLSAARVFMVYAFLQAKLSIPGIGGNTRIVTMTDKGEIRYMKSWSVIEIQSFFGALDSRIRAEVQILDQLEGKDDPIERFLRIISSGVIDDYQNLKKALEKIEEDDTLV